MSPPLRILIVERSEGECALLLGALRRGGYDPVCRRVYDARTMEKALDEEDWDVVAADCSMPFFDAGEALAAVQQRGLDLPFIVLAEKKDERAAVELMRSGAHDYVIKEGLGRLSPAVEREVREAEVRREREKAEQQLRKSVDALVAIYEASQLLSSTLESEEIGTRLLKIMQRISRLSTAVISMPDEHGELRVWRAIGLESLWSKVRYTPEAKAALHEVLDSGEHRLLQLQHPSQTEQSLSTLYLPLRIRERILGVLEVYSPRGLADDETVETEILVSLASKAASALENARLYGKLSERERQLQELVGKLITAQEEERRRIAYEVHDGLTQVAVAAHHHLQAFTARHPAGSLQDQEILDKGVELVRRTVEESRSVIANLRPTTLDDFGLAAAIRHQVESLRREGWEVTYEENTGDGRLPVPVETALYRVTQEALTNVRKHAQTTKIHIGLRREEQAVRLNVRDWGGGFDPAGLTAGGPGERVGISGMRERAALIGGELEIWSEENAGTSITVRVPLPPASG